MRSIFLVALAVLALGSPAAARMFELSCDDLYPEAEFPENTTAIAEVTQDADGVNGLHCYLVEGSPSDVCNISDGTCCECNVKRGFTPECSIKLVYTESSTSAACLNTFPLCYYGNQCDTPWVMATAEEVPAIIRRKKRKGKGKGSVKTSFTAPTPRPINTATVTTTTEPAPTSTTETTGTTTPVTSTTSVTFKPSHPFPTK